MIYLDNAATTFPKPVSVCDEMDRVSRTLSVNAGRGSYKAAREATAIIDDTKNRLLQLFNANGNYSVVFTPTITHAFNQILWGADVADMSVIYISPYEHNAVARTVEAVRKHNNAKVIMLPVDENGEIDVDKTRFLFSKDAPSLLIMTAISNVTGYILPYKEVFMCAKEANPECLTVLDSAQAAGLIDINVNKINVDILAFAGHKTLCGPFGIGGFILKEGVGLEVTLAGGTGSDSLNLNMPDDAPSKYEAASPNIVAIAGLREALKIIDVDKHYIHVSELTTYMVSRLKSVGKVHILGYTGRNIGIVSFVVEGYASSDVGDILDEEYDIAVRTGYHCTPGIHSILKDTSYAGTVRASVGIFNTKEDIDSLICALKTL